MALSHHTPRTPTLEDAIVALFCLVDDAYRKLNPPEQSYATLKKLSDSEVLTLTLLQQLRGIESERSFLPDTQRFFSHLFPGVLGLHPSSLHRRVRKNLGASWNPCGARSFPSWWANPRHSSSTRRCLGGVAPTPGGRFGGLGEALGRGGVGAVGLLLGLRRQALHMLCA